MNQIIDEPLIKSGTELLRFEGPIDVGGEFVDLMPSMPAEYGVLDKHDIASSKPPLGMSDAQYVHMLPLYHVMNAAISEHDQDVMEEETERFREDFWERFGEGPQGPEIMRRSYRRNLAGRLVALLAKGGQREILDLSEGKRMMDSLTGDLP